MCIERALTRSYAGRKLRTPQKWGHLKGAARLNVILANGTYTSPRRSLPASGQG
jgi:hypothetical protein